MQLHQANPSSPLHPLWKTWVLQRTTTWPAERGECAEHPSTSKVSCLASCFLPNDSPIPPSFGSEWIVWFCPILSLQNAFWDKHKSLQASRALCPDKSLKLGFCVFDTLQIFKSCAEQTNYVVKPRCAEYPIANLWCWESSRASFTVIQNLRILSSLYYLLWGPKWQRAFVSRPPKLKTSASSFVNKHRCISCWSHWFVHLSCCKLQIVASQCSWLGNRQTFPPESKSAGSEAILHDVPGEFYRVLSFGPAFAKKCQVKGQGWDGWDAQVAKRLFRRSGALHGYHLDVVFVLARSPCWRDTFAKALTVHSVN